MALIVEDGTGKTDANAYWGLTDVDDYFTSWEVGAWNGTNAAKELAIRQATRSMDFTYRVRYRGAKMTTDQALQWPRTAFVSCDNILIEEGTMPLALQEAMAELALKFLEGQDDLRHESDYSPSTSGANQAILEETIETDTARESRKYASPVVTSGTAADYPMVESKLTPYLHGAPLYRA